MKKFFNNFRLSVRFVVSIITSREFAFIFCVTGTIAQVAHTFYLVENISSLQGFWKTFQALLLAIFISGSLLYFTAIAINDETKEAKKIHNTITLFTIIEILINIYYYSHSLLVDNIDFKSSSIFDYIFAILISCMVPVTIKLYSSHIRAKEWQDELDSIGKPEEIDPKHKISIYDKTLTTNKELIEKVNNDPEERKKLDGIINEVDAMEFESNEEEIEPEFEPELENQSIHTFEYEDSIQKDLEAEENLPQPKTETETETFNEQDYIIMQEKIDAYFEQKRLEHEATIEQSKKDSIVELNRHFLTLSKQFDAKVKDSIDNLNKIGKDKELEAQTILDNIDSKMLDIKSEINNHTQAVFNRYLSQNNMVTKK